MKMNADSHREVSIVILKAVSLESISLQRCLACLWARKYQLPRNYRVHVSLRP